VDGEGGGGEGRTVLKSLMAALMAVWAWLVGGLWVASRSEMTAFLASSNLVPGIRAVARIESLD